jgi:anti-sigma B factor antagonist
MTTCSIETRTAPERGAVRVAVAGELDLATLPALERVLAAGARSGRDVLLDLERVTFIDCSSLGAIAEAADRACERGHQLVLWPSPAVERLVELLGGWPRLGDGVSRAS